MGSGNRRVEWRKVLKDCGGRMEGGGGDANLLHIDQRRRVEEL